MLRVDSKTNKQKRNADQLVIGVSVFVTAAERLGQIQFLLFVLCLLSATERSDQVLCEQLLFLHARYLVLFKRSEVSATAEAGYFRIEVPMSKLELLNALQVGRVHLFHSSSRCWFLEYVGP